MSAISEISPFECRFIKVLDAALKANVFVDESDPISLGDGYAKLCTNPMRI